ncbi:MAG: DUF72 domain-containing protein [Candidatus Bilamarchaeaceae archaeon]
MKPKIKIGCCGWGYLMPSARFGADWKKQFSSVLSAYSSLFSLVEVNSTFYRIPKVSTAEKWLSEARGESRKFEFTVKASQIITHKAIFEKEAFWAFERMKEICAALEARILLLQTPGSFGPSTVNIKKMSGFLQKIERDNLIIAWEPRGKWWNEPEKIKEICRKFDLVNCVDPLRNEPQYFGKKGIAYFRLHGFGKPTMYQYVFSDKELKVLKEKVSSLKCKECYVLFNNMAMYDDALRFKKLLRKINSLCK